MNALRGMGPCLASTVLGMLTAATAVAQQPVKPAVADKAGVPRMEIYNGTLRTVHYFTGGMSPGEQMALRDLERAENDVALADQIQMLKRQYISDEHGLEARRRQVQQLLYGQSTAYNVGFYPQLPFIGGAMSGALPYTYGYGYGGGGFYGYGSGYTGSESGIEARSAAFGVGNEGVVKNEIARSLTISATPEAMAQSNRQLGTAMAKASESPRLRAGLGLGDRAIVPVANERAGGPIVITMKNGEKIEGTLVHENSEWVMVDTRTEQLSIRWADVSRVSRPKK